MSGRIEVHDRGKTHAIQIAEGAIHGVQSEESKKNRVALGLTQYLERLFSLQRPHVLWSPSDNATRGAFEIDPQYVILGGVTMRRDLWRPLPLIERIPAETLRVDPERLHAIRRLPFSSEEIEFLKRLTIPAPIPMILWKRGLEPEHAGALLVALNLLGLFEGTWRSGDLPRLGAATRIRRKVNASRPDHELLGVDEEAPIEAVDRAFRRLSLELHPDRLMGLSEKEAVAARAAFTSASAAYGRLKNSRRMRPVRHATSIGKVELTRRPVDRWFNMLALARTADGKGDLRRARAFAMKALALSPPGDIRAELLKILKRAA
ncbi:MAG: J domain-containing protein [Deltaproteobacteria bacterium]|nr:J domain-containing protein [Deltaproteobacteria bacterium]